MHLIKFERFLCWKSRNHSQHFSVDFFSRNLSRIINYWGSIFTLYLTWGAFRLVFVLSVFFFFFFLFLLFFFFRFLPAFSLTGTNRERRVNHYFYCFPLAPTHEYIFSSSRFLPLRFNWSICNYQTDSWWDMFSLEVWILLAFSLIQLSRSYWLSYFKSVFDHFVGLGLKGLSNWH